MSFPQNPEPGTIFELRPGVYYIYDASQKSWKRAEGIKTPPATNLSSGLMSAADYSKLAQLVLPPPQSTITVEGAAAKFEGGVIALRSGDQFVSIDADGLMMNKAAGITKQNAIAAGRKLHEHTYSFDISIDTNEFFNFMLESGRFVVRSPKGKQGPVGDRGLDGADELDFGPDGKQGPAGANASFDMSLQADPITFQQRPDSQRAIISISTEEISKDENYLVVTRANIGNPDACPSIVRLTSGDASTWVLAMPDTAANTQVTWLPGSCLTCSGQLYYLDISAILDAIRDEFEREVRDIKHDMEQIVTFWLTVMSGVFDEQKAALCCALEHCKSQHRNAQARRAIEEQRIQAAQTQTQTGVIYQFDEEGNKIGEVYQLKGHSLVIDSDPRNSGKSVVVKQAMDAACKPGGFGTANANNLPNNSDPIGGSQCVPGIAIVNGKSIIYDDCPPGFIPRRYQRSYQKGLEYEGESRAYPADYVPPSQQNYGDWPPGSVRGINYSPYGSAVAGVGVNLKRSNNAETMTSLTVSVTADDNEYRTGVLIAVKDKATGKVLGSGQTKETGAVTFSNMSILDSYLVEVSKSGFSFEPASWINLGLKANQTLEVSTTCTPTVAVVGDGIYAIKDCGVGYNQLHVNIIGDTAKAKMAYVRLYNYVDGIYRCGGQASPTGQIRFKGLGAGQYVIKVNVDSDTQYDYIVSPPCDPGVVGTSTFLSKLRKCRTVTFSDGRGYQLSTVAFDIRSVPKISPAAESVEIVTPDDSRYEKLLEEQKQEINRPTPVIVTDDMVPVELDSASPAYSISYVSDLGSGPDTVIGNPYKRNVDGATKFNDLLFEGNYVLAITNDSNGPAPLKLVCTTKSMAFIEGQGQGWDASYISGEPVATVLEYANGLEPGQTWWIRTKVVVPRPLQPPYSRDCGAIGPRPSALDGKLCRQLAVGVGDPISRKPNTVGDGTLQDWTVGKCGGVPLPDALMLRCTGSLYGLGEVVLCRVRNGSYSGGFNYNDRSAQVVVEQIGTTSPATPGVKTLSGTTFKCTILVWNSQDCKGSTTEFGTDVIEVDPALFKLSGSWRLNDGGVDFEIVPADNNYESKLADKSDYELVISGSLPDAFKSASIDLPAGHYFIDISGCCMRVGAQFTGHIEIEYQIQTGRYIKKFPNLGASTNNDTVSAAYKGLTIQIDHSGGPVIARLVTPVLSQSDGNIVVHFSNSDVSSTRVTTNISQNMAGESCQIHSSYLKWYREGWTSSNCIGLVTNVAGQDYIIISRSGNVGSVPCAGKYPNMAVAWPTIDGSDFVGLPDTGSVIFKRDDGLANSVRSNIASGKYESGIGDLSKIGVILFPTIQQ